MNLSGGVTKNFMGWGALVVALLGAGCSDSSGGKPNPKNVNAKNFCSQFAEVACYNMWTCCTGLQIERMLGQTLSITEASCRDDMKLRCEDTFALQLDAVANDTATINTEKAAACFKTLLVPDHNSCFLVPKDTVFDNTITENCSQSALFEGSVPVGSECSSDWECGTDAYCGQLDGGLCNGLVAGCICKTLNPANGSCCASGECAAGLYCETPSGIVCSLTTSPGTCTAQVAFGAACTSSNQCDSNFCEAGRCQGATWMSCYSDSDCYSYGPCIGGRVCSLSDTSARAFCTITGRIINTDSIIIN